MAMKYLIGELKIFFKRLNFEKNKNNRRINFIFYFFIFLFFLIAVRLADLQILRHNFFLTQAKEQRDFSSVLPAIRGNIFSVDRFGEAIPLAINKNTYFAYAIPKDISEKEEFAKRISEILKVDYEVLLKRISKDDDPYEPIQQSAVSEELKSEIEKLNIKGIGFKTNQGRFYPNGALASHLTGFLSFKNMEGVGQYGLEEFYDKALAGKSGFISGEQDSLGAHLIGQNEESYTAVDGDSIFLTIDPNVQHEIESRLKEVIEKWDAESGSVIVMEPSTGRILGMAGYPNFDPNTYAEVKDIGVFSNQAVSGQYEPGSIFKPITMAIGLDTNAVTPNMTYEDKGQLSISGYTIKNYDGKVHGVNTMTQVLEKSLNTGTVFVVEKIPKDTYFNYVKNFGLGEKTNIDLPVEIRGNLNNLKTNRDINYATASFGQGIAVTPIQMITAISALANKGKLVKPRIVDKIQHQNGSEESLKTEAMRQVISEKTAGEIVSMLVSVVENGFDKAKIPGYFVAGKTGTAQIPNSAGKGYSDETIHSFVGFAPAYDARFVVLIKLDRPKGVQFASVSLTSVFRDIMSYLLHYYEVQPNY